MIEVKLYELISAKPAIEKLRDAQGLKVAVLYKLKMLLSLISTRHQAYEESRINLIKTLGTVKVDNEERISPDKEEDFRGQMAELVNTVEKLDIDPTPLKDIENAEGLTVRDLELLEKFIQA
jgi:hypothetical protein